MTVITEAHNKKTKQGSKEGVSSQRISNLINSSQESHVMPWRGLVNLSQSTEAIGKSSKLKSLPRKEPLVTKTSLLDRINTSLPTKPKYKPKSQFNYNSFESYRSSTEKAYGLSSCGHFAKTWRKCLVPIDKRKGNIYSKTRVKDHRVQASPLHKKCTTFSSIFMCKRKSLDSLLASPLLPFCCCGYYQIVFQPLKSRGQCPLNSRHPILHVQFQ